jgi:hypothetical protein
LNEQYPEKKAVGRPRQYLKQVARNTGADNYTAILCNKSKWKAASQSKDCRITSWEKTVPYFFYRLYEINKSPIKEVRQLFLTEHYSFN